MLEPLHRNTWLFKFAENYFIFPQILHFSYLRAFLKDCEYASFANFVYPKLESKADFTVFCPTEVTDSFVSQSYQPYLTDALCLADIWDFLSI